MSIKFNFNGISVEADNAEEAAALIRALGGATASAATPTNSAQPPATSQSAVGGSHGNPRSRPKVAAKATKAPPPQNADAEMVDATRRFLEAVKAAGSDGVIGETLLPIFGANHAKGLGSKLASANKLLIMLGYTREGDAYRSKRSKDNGGGRIWWAGRKIDQAIADLRLVG